jgi:hypothetical protein
MVRLYFPVTFRKQIKNSQYPKFIGLGEYDGDAGVDGEISGCKFHGTLAGYGTTSRWYFDTIHFYVTCDKIDDVIQTARSIEKALRDKELQFEIPYYELTVKIPFMLPIHVVVSNEPCKYEILSENVSIQCEKLEQIEAIKK